MARKERYVVGLDVGTSKVAAIVGEMMDDGTLDIIGIGLADSKGIRRGVVNNVDSAAEAIKKAIDEAELTAGVEIDTVYLGLSGAHVKAFNSRGVVAVAGRNREITREDVKRAMKATIRARNVKGEEFEITGEELLARAMQHEVDHLNGILFLQHLSALKRDLIRRKIRKLQKAGEWD